MPIHVLIVLLTCVLLAAGLTVWGAALLLSGGLWGLPIAGVVALVAHLAVWRYGRQQSD